jgi:hypothetical protein
MYDPEQSSWIIFKWESEASNNERNRRCGLKFVRGAHKHGPCAAFRTRSMPGISSPYEFLEILLRHPQKQSAMVSLMQVEGLRSKYGLNSAQSHTRQATVVQFLLLDVQSLLLQHICTRTRIVAAEVVSHSNTKGSIESERTNCRLACDAKRPKKNVDVPQF